MLSCAHLWAWILYVCNWQCHITSGFPPDSCEASGSCERFKCYQSYWWYYRAWLTIKADFEVPISVGRYLGSKCVWSYSRCGRLIREGQQQLQDFWNGFGGFKDCTWEIEGVNWWRASYFSSWKWAFIVGHGLENISNHLDAHVSRLEERVVDMEKTLREA